VNGFNVVSQQFITMYDIGCQICCNWSRLEVSAPKYHAGDKHDIPPDHFKLTVGQSALL